MGNNKRPGETRGGEARHRRQWATRHSGHTVEEQGGHLKIALRTLNSNYTVWRNIKTHFFCVVRCGTRSSSKRVPCPFLKVVLEAKNGHQKDENT